jgi:hypothetical protein
VGGPLISFANRKGEDTGTPGKLRICGDCGLIIYKFAGLRFADWPTSEICGFAIAE